MKKNITKFIYPLVALASISAISVGVTYAVFATTDIANQEVYRTEGEMKKSIFLDCDEKWNLGYGEIYYAFFFTEVNSVVTASEFTVPSSVVSLTLSGDESGTRNVMVYEFDSLVYETIIFVRCNPDGLTDGNVWEKKWNQTANITYSSSVNYYKITSLDGDNCSYSSGLIDENGSVDYL